MVNVVSKVCVCVMVNVVMRVYQWFRWLSIIYICISLSAVILIVVSVCTATGAWNWLIDPDTQKVRLCV